MASLSGNFATVRLPPLPVNAGKLACSYRNRYDRNMSDGGPFPDGSAQSDAIGDMLSSAKKHRRQLATKRRDRTTPRGAR